MAWTPQRGLDLFDNLIIQPILQNSINLLYILLFAVAMLADMRIMFIIEWVLDTK
jgi:hypothetical protein